MWTLGTFLLLESETYLRVLNTLSGFYAIFCKGDNFCDIIFSSEHHNLSKNGSSMKRKKEVAAVGSKFFYSRVGLISEVSKN